MKVDFLWLAVIYSIATALFLALCLALQLFDELRGDGSELDRVPGSAGDGESTFHSTDVTDEGQHNHA